MTTDDRDPLLQSLFAEAPRDLDAEAFTAQVMRRTRFLRFRGVAPWLAVALLVVCVWFLTIPLEVAQLIAQGLTITLIDLGDGWLAWVFSPVNNIAAILVLTAKAARMVRKKIVGASYAH